MPSSTDYLENKLVDFLLRGQPFVPPATLYVALFTTSPSDAGGGTEVSGSGYSRAAITSSLISWAGTQGAGTTGVSTGTSSRTSNNAAITFGSPTSPWGSVTAAGLMDAPTGGNLWFYAPLASSKGVAAGDPVSTFAPGAMIWGIDYTEGASAGIETTFDSLFTSWTPNTGTAVVAKPAQSKPASKASNLTTPSYTSAFGVPVFRATQVSDSPDGVVYLIHDSSRRQAHNCDNTRFVARATNSYWYLYDASTFAVLNGGRTIAQGLGALGSGATGAPIGDNELWWHPTDPNTFYWMDSNGGLQIRLFDIVSKTSTVAVDLTGRLGGVGMGTATRVTTRAEGRMSDDGRYAAFMVRNIDAMLGVICVDLIDDLIVGALLTTNLPDHVSMSPLGNYVVVSWSGATGMDYNVAAAASVDSTNGVRAYNRTFSTFTQINTYGEHSDLGIDTLGNEVIVTACFTYRMDIRGVADGDIYYARLDNGVCTVLPVGDMYDGGSVAVHFNCTATKQSGFAVMSTQVSSGNTVVSWNDECVMLIELAPTAAKHLRLVHHHTAYVDEWSAPEATINRDGTRVTFRTNFGASNVESYVAVLPSDWKVRAGFS